jgi:hypothetical protein
MFCYVAAGTGRYTGTVLGPVMGGLEYGFLEYKLQAVGARLTAYAIDQVDYLDKRRQTLRGAMVKRFPYIADGLRPIYHRIRPPRRPTA